LGINSGVIYAQNKLAKLASDLPKFIRKPRKIILYILAARPYEKIIFVNAANRAEINVL
jgi:hypothetical protein